MLLSFFIFEINQNIKMQSIQSYSLIPTFNTQNSQQLINFIIFILMLKQSKSLRAQSKSNVDSTISNQTLLEQAQINQDQRLVTKLKKIPKYDREQKKSAIIKFITKDSSKIQKLKNLQEAKVNLPILQAVINYGKYGQNSAFDQIIDKSQFNSLQLKSPRIKTNNPFADILQLSKSKLIKKSVQFPKQLKQLKKQLYELPCIAKKMQKQMTEPLISLKTKIKNIKDLCKSYQLEKKDDFFSQDQNLNLQKSLLKAYSQRRHKTQMTVKTQNLPKIVFNSKSKKQAFSNYKQKYFKSLSNILEESSPKNSANSQTTLMFVKANQKSRSNAGTNKLNPESLGKSPQVNGKKVQKYWPYYKKYSPYNDKILQKRVKQMSVNIKQFLQFCQPPSQETMKIFKGIRIIQKEQDDYMQKEAIEQQKNMTETKYNLKLQNLKDSYLRNMKQFINFKRMSSIQKKKRDFDQNKNMSKRIVKLNEKIIVQIKNQQQKQKQKQNQQIY